MVSIFFVTPTQLSFIDLITMGDSEKMEDSSTIGQFGSGLKYAIALLLRNNVQLNFRVKGNTYIGGRNRDYEEIFTPHTYLKEDEFTGKSKELIGFNVSREFESFNSIHSEDIFECVIDENYETGFALQLGYNWELWMALREIYSNMLDEKGRYFENSISEPSNYGTFIELKFEENSEFNEIWKNRHNFIKEDRWTWELPNGIKLCDNSDKWLKIYKNNIVIYEDRDCQTNFSFQDNSAEIDERRLINNVYSTFNKIASGIAGSFDKSLLKIIVSNSLEEDEFLSKRSALSEWEYVSDEVFEVIDEIVSEYGDFKTYDFLYRRLVKDSRYKHSGRVLNTISTSLYYSKDVIIESVPEVTPTLKTKKDEIVSKYNIDLSDIEVKESILIGNSCVADKFNKVIIISNEFDIEKQMSEFIVQYYSILYNDNIIKLLSNELERLLRK